MNNFEDVNNSENIKGEIEQNAAEQNKSKETLIVDKDNKNEVIDIYDILKTSYDPTILKIASVQRIANIPDEFIGELFSAYTGGEAEITTEEGAITALKAVYEHLAQYISELPNGIVIDPNTGELDVKKSIEQEEQYGMSNSNTDLFGNKIISKEELKQLKLEMQENSKEKFKEKFDDKDEILNKYLNTISYEEAVKRYNSYSDEGLKKSLGEKNSDRYKELFIRNRINSQEQLNDYINIFEMTEKIKNGDIDIENVEGLFSSLQKRQQDRILNSDGNNIAEKMTSFFEKYRNEKNQERYYRKMTDIMNGDVDLSKDHGKAVVYSCILLAEKNGDKEYIDAILSKYEGQIHYTPRDRFINEINRIKAYSPEDQKVKFVDTPESREDFLNNQFYIDNREMVETFKNIGKSIEEYRGEIAEDSMQSQMFKDSINRELYLEKMQESRISNVRFTMQSMAVLKAQRMSVKGKNENQNAEKDDTLKYYKYFAQKEYNEYVQNLKSRYGENIKPVDINEYIYDESGPANAFRLLLQSEKKDYKEYLTFGFQGMVVDFNKLEDIPDITDEEAKDVERNYNSMISMSENMSDSKYNQSYKVFNLLNLYEITPLSEKDKIEKIKADIFEMVEKNFDVLDKITLSVLGSTFRNEIGELKEKIAHNELEALKESRNITDPEEIKGNKKISDQEFEKMPKTEINISALDNKEKDDSKIPIGDEEFVGYAEKNETDLDSTATTYEVTNKDNNETAKIFTDGKSNDGNVTVVIDGAVAESKEYTDEELKKFEKETQEEANESNTPSNDKPVEPDKALITKDENTNSFKNIFNALKNNFNKIKGIFAGKDKKEKENQEINQAKDQNGQLDQFVNKSNTLNANGHGTMLETIVVSEEVKANLERTSNEMRIKQQNSNNVKINQPQVEKENQEDRTE